MLKTSSTLILFLFLSSFIGLDLERPVPTANKDFTWLLGSWQRANEKEGRQTYEHWTKQSNTRYIGIGCTLKEGDTIWKENIVLREVEKQWQFEVIGQGEVKATVFKLTQIKESSFTCENPANEFPKIISYHKSASGLKAEISGGGPQIVFEFKKIND
ncbi:DUF6265 family protein [Lutimonas sp.]|uniref:DUF6265 family protein n=1 Tax=Lutimonas sp. TaxID=1872403 RepID=UPI003D9B858F